MNYLELINKCLVELNYKKVTAFSELTKNEHEKIKNIINVINSEICYTYNWNFLLKSLKSTLIAGTGDITNPVEGKILTLKIDNKIYKFTPDFEKFFTNEQKPDTYSIFNDKILLPQFEEDKEIDITYYSNSYAITEQGQPKKYLEQSEDKSVIPEPFVEPLIVYGTCMRLKGNPQHIRFNYWMSMYKSALANLVANSTDCAQDYPNVKLKRF